jgi:hypothetical protein
MNIPFFSRSKLGVSLAERVLLVSREILNEITSLSDGFCLSCLAQHWAQHLGQTQQRQQCQVQWETSASSIVVMHEDGV